jgi:hypothetical protein
VSKKGAVKRFSTAFVGPVSREFAVMSTGVGKRQSRCSQRPFCGHSNDPRGDVSQPRDSASRGIVGTSRPAGNVVAAKL